MMLDNLITHNDFNQFLLQKGVEGGVLITDDKDKNNTFITIVIEKQSLYFRLFKLEKIKKAVIERTSTNCVVNFAQFI